MNFLGNKLKILRKEFNFTQYDLAKKLNLSSSSISKYENNKVVPKNGTIKKLMDIFNVEKSYFYELSNGSLTSNNIQKNDKNLCSSLSKTKKLISGFNSLSNLNLGYRDILKNNHNWNSSLNETKKLFSSSNSFSNLSLGHADIFKNNHNWNSSLNETKKLISSFNSFSNLNLGYDAIFKNNYNWNSSLNEAKKLFSNFNSFSNLNLGYDAIFKNNHNWNSSLNETKKLFSNFNSFSNLNMTSPYSKIFDNNSLWSSIYKNEIFNKTSKIIHELNLLSKPIDFNENYIKKFMETYSFDDEILDDVNLEAYQNLINNDKLVIENISININQNKDYSIKDRVINVTVDKLITYFLTVIFLMLSSVIQYQEYDIVDYLMPNIGVNFEKPIINANDESVYTAKKNYTVYKKIYEYEEVGTLLKGNEFKILHENDNWILVEFNNDSKCITGWIKRENFKLEDATMIT